MDEKSCHKSHDAVDPTTFLIGNTILDIEIIGIIKYLLKVQPQLIFMKDPISCAPPSVNVFHSSLYCTCMLVIPTKFASGPE